MFPWHLFLFLCFFFMLGMRLNFFMCSLFFGAPELYIRELALAQVMSIERVMLFVLSDQFNQTNKRSQTLVFI